MLMRKVPTPMFAALKFVMARLDRAIHAFVFCLFRTEQMDGPVKPGHDGEIGRLRLHALTWSIA